jgi:hypothetical protein
MTFVGIEGGVANEKTCPYEGSRFERSRRSQIPDTQIILQGTLYSLLTVDGSLRVIYLKLTYRETA